MVSHLDVGHFEANATLSRRSKSNEKLVNQKYATLFLSWMPFSQLFFTLFSGFSFLNLDEIDHEIDQITWI